MTTRKAELNPTTLVMVELEKLSSRVSAAMADGWRFGLMTARRLDDSGTLALITLLLHPNRSLLCVLESPLPPGVRTFPSLTTHVPQAHWSERAIFDLFGLRPVGHPRFKSLLMHEDWPVGFYPLNDAHQNIDDDTARPPHEFLTVKGDGVYEIPVGPIHAGIIEPGHFRFSCLGEVIQNLEIRLGYAHRGIEEQFERIPWQQCRFLAEAASSDTAVGNALAHAIAIEEIAGVEVPPAAIVLRAVALEIERTASHLGELGGICGDIGYAGGATVFGRLRGRALGLGERLTGARFQTAYVVPGGVSQPVSETMRAEILAEAHGLETEFARAKLMISDNSGALERMEGIGKLPRSLASDFGLVGPAARACGIGYDVRRSFNQKPYSALSWNVATAEEGDVLARVNVRIRETHESLSLIRRLMTEQFLSGEICTPMPPALPPDSIGIGLVEAWGGELIHMVFTNKRGIVSRYCIKDPSFNNWTGLSISVRRQLVADFPLCNKSFGLSYSGNDL